MSRLLSLAGQTAQYGVSTILARILNYALVPLHTAVFFPEQFGIITYLYAYVAFLNIIYTYGMETAFFRFTTRERNPDIYNVAATSLLLSSLVFSGAIYLLSSPISEMIGRPSYDHLIRWLSIIMFFDAVVAIPFARLRLDNKAWSFVRARVSSVVIIVLMNLFFLAALPWMSTKDPDSVLYRISESLYDPQMGIGYVFLANLIGSASLILFLNKSLLQIRLKLDWARMKPMLWYALPVMVMGLAGMVNENLDKILLDRILPDDFYSDKSPIEAVGIYGAAFKLSIFMILAIQAFRYAGEPFYFSHAEEEDSPELFAKVLHYFTVFGVIILVAVSFNVEWIGRIFLQREEFRQALYLVPILLLGKLLFGIYINISIWLKLTDKTIYGVWFSLLGAGITITGNILLVPVLGYDGSAISMVLCYLGMCVIAYRVGRRHMKIPYNFKAIIIYIFISMSLVLGNLVFTLQDFWLEVAFNVVASLIFIGVVYVFERKRLKSVTDRLG